MVQFTVSPSAGFVRSRACRGPTLRALLVDPAKVLGDDMGRSEWGYYRAGLIQGYGRALRELEKRDDGEEETHPSTGENRQS